MDAHEIELMAWCYVACSWTSLGLYAVGDKPWGCRECFGAVIHGANLGMITGFMTFRFIGISAPWKFIGLACATSAGWTRKEDIVAIIKRIIGK